MKIKFQLENDEIATVSEWKKTYEKKNVGKLDEMK